MIDFGFDAGGLDLPELTDASLDIDGDLIPDTFDSDLDGDLVPDSIGGRDMNHNGIDDSIDVSADFDGDGISDQFDTFTDANHNGVADFAAKTDFANLGITNPF